MRRFLLQLSWELRRLWARPRTYLGFGVTFCFELVLSLLWRLPSVRELMSREFWKMHVQLEQGLSGLTTAVHMTSETMAMIAMLFFGLVASDIVAKEIEDGTLRMIFSRPVGRGSVFVQKLIACAVYSLALTVFVGATALALGMLFEGPGRLVVINFRENVVCALSFERGLTRYVLAIGMLAASFSTVTLLGFALSCQGLKPGAVIVVGGAILMADQLIRIQPGLAGISPYMLTTRLVSWRQVFNDTIPWLRLQRNYTQLLGLDLTLILLAWWAFRRRELPQ